MKRNTHTIVPAKDFRLISGENDLSCYQVTRGLIITVMQIIIGFEGFKGSMLLPGDQGVDN